MSKIVSKGWRYVRCGPIASVLKQETFDVIPNNDSVLLEMQQVPLHRVDASIVNGSALGRKRLTLSSFPRIGGSEGVGKVISRGSSQTVKEGDTVWVAPLHGTWATKIAVTPSMVHKIDPRHTHLAVNASNYLAAQQMLNGYARLQKGQVVLQNGGSSVTSLAVSALAKSRGLKVLTASTPGPRFEDAKARHAKYSSEVFEYNGQGARSMRQVLANGGASLYVNAVGGRHFDSFLSLVGSDGHVVTYGAQNGIGMMFSSGNLIYNEVSLHGLFLPSYLASLSYGERQTQLDFVLQELFSVGFSYPTVAAMSLDELPKVWDDTFITGGKKGVVFLSK